ncbi:MAG: hypothetical protein ACFB0A_09420 [Croceivirga sp.]
MKLKKLGFLLFGLVLLGCSSDDAENDGIVEQELAIANVTAVGQDFDNVYQYSFDGNMGASEQINLTAELNVTPDYLTLREVEDLLSFYFFADGAFSVILKDVRSGASASFDDFFPNSAGRSLVWGVNNESNVVFGFFGPSGTRNFGIQDIDLQTLNSADTEIDEDIDFIFQPILFNNKVYFTYRDNGGDYKFSFYDIREKQRGPILNFRDVPISFLFTESGEVAIVKNGVSASLEIYDPDVLQLIERFELNFNTGFSAGPVEGAFFDGKTLFYPFSFVQPAEFSFGPAFFDVETQENTVIDLIRITTEVENELNTDIGITVQVYDGIQNLFFVGYEVLDQSARGGILQINTEGNLITNITTDFVPTYFLRN